MDGYVATLLALAQHPSLRPLLKRLDAPACLEHVYLNHQSPLPTSGFVCAATCEALPALPVNSRRVTNSSYAQTVCCEGGWCLCLPRVCVGGGRVLGAVTCVSMSRVLFFFLHQLHISNHHPLTRHPTPIPPTHF
jgi:hypothetical protein